MDEDISTLALDDQFMILLHKKIMHRTGSAKRRAKKYYLDQYKKTGIIPKPLWLAANGVMEGRKCSGRSPALSHDVKNRFIEMLKASCDIDDPRFIYITRKARVITTYHQFLQEEFQKDISVHALRRLVGKNNLDIYLNQPDFQQPQMDKGCFNPEEIFDLVQVDGCRFQYLKIKDPHGQWSKPQVIEFYDTGSRYMFVLDLYFSENSENAVDLFSRFLLDVPFPNKTMAVGKTRFLDLIKPTKLITVRFESLDNKHEILASILQKLNYDAQTSYWRTSAHLKKNLPPLGVFYHYR